MRKWNNENSIVLKRFRWIRKDSLRFVARKCEKIINSGSLTGDRNPKHSDLHSNALPLNERELSCCLSYMTRTVHILHEGVERDEYYSFFFRQAFDYAMVSKWNLNTS